jgi:hypothetical protein
MPAVLQVSRPSKYHPDWGVLLGPTTPDPTVNTSMLSIHSGSGNGSPLANGGGEAPRKPSNPNRLYISGLPYNWRTQHVSLGLVWISEIMQGWAGQWLARPGVRLFCRVVCEVGKLQQQHRVVGCSGLSMALNSSSIARLRTAR